MRNMSALKVIVSFLFGLSLLGTATPAGAVTVCADGSYAASYDANICIPASPGSYVAVNATSSTQCTPGTYQPYFGQTSCLSAQVGNYVTGFGNTWVNPCPPGTFQAAAIAISCDPVPAGKYSPGKGVSSSDSFLSCTSLAGPVTTNLSRTGNAIESDCYDFTDDYLVSPKSSASYDNTLDFALYAKNGLAQDGVLGTSHNMNILLTNTSTNAVIEIQTHKMGDGIGAQKTNFSLFNNWTNGSNIRGCQTSCAGSPILVTSFPLGVYNIQLTVKDLTNASKVYTLTNVTLGDTTTRPVELYVSRPMSGYTLATGSFAVTPILGEISGSETTKIILRDAPLGFSATKTRTYTINMGSELVKEISVPLRGSPSATSIANVTGSDISSGLWWVIVESSDVLLHSAKSTYWLTPIHVIDDCDAGKFSVNGIKPCESSPAGYFENYPQIQSFNPTNGIFAPTPCQIGTFQSQIGQTNCIDAQAGRYVNITGSSASFPCPTGTYQPTAGQRECVVSQPGYFVADPGSATSFPCPAGTYQPDIRSTGCLPTLAGYFAAEPGTANASACDPGTYQPGTQTIACVLAPAGSYVAGTAKTASTSCAAGTYQPNTGTAACIPAAVGFYVTGTGSTTVTACAAGTYQPLTGQTDCIPIPPVTVVEAAPAAVYAPTLKEKKSVTSKTLASGLAMAIPAKAKVAVKRASASKKACRVSGTKIVGIKAGSCLVTVTVQGPKPKKGKKPAAVVKTVVVNVVK